MAKIEQLQIYDYLYILKHTSKRVLDIIYCKKSMI